LRVGQVKFDEPVDQCWHLGHRAVDNPREESRGFVWRPAGMLRQIGKPTLTMTDRIHADGQQPELGKAAQFGQVDFLVRAKTVKPQHRRQG
jgi:hypothetical protein